MIPCVHLEQFARLQVTLVSLNALLEVECLHRAVALQVAGRLVDVAPVLLTLIAHRGHTAAAAHAYQFNIPLIAAK